MAEVNEVTNEQVIVLALDGSEESEKAVRWYLERVHRASNKLIFVHCVELPDMKHSKARDLHMSPGVLAELWKEEELKTKALEEHMKALLKEKGLTEGIMKTVTGKPGEAICRTAEEVNAVMIIMGTRGLGKVKRTLLGSVSDYLIHHATCPVVVCRHGEPEGKQRHSSASSNDGDKKQRHTSGDSFRARLTSWGKSLSLSEPEDKENKQKKDKEKEKDKATSK